jgi:hypothetical protein
MSKPRLPDISQMNKNSLPLVFALIAAICAAVTSARATPFQFSYTFHDGSVWTGGFDGTQSGNIVTANSDYTLFENGISVPGSISGGHWSGSAVVAGGAIFSFDGTQNNFFLINSNSFTGYSSSNTWFYELVPNNTIFYHESNGSGDINDSSISTNRWSLTEASVPDCGATIAMIGATMFGLAAFRRKFARA